MGDKRILKVLFLGGFATSTTERAATRKQTLFRKLRSSLHEIIKPEYEVQRRQDKN